MRFTSSLKLKLIYVFRINDAAHRGCLKIGEATCEDENVFGLSPNSKALNEAARKRINQYTQTAGIAYDLLYLKSATKLFSVLLASKRPLITELADKLRLKYPLLPTISPCPTMRLEAIRSIIPISCRRYPKSV